MENEEINKQILLIWKEYIGKHEGTELYPLLLPELKKNCILFIGINPGFPKKTKNDDYWGRNLPKGTIPEDYFRFPDGDMKKVENQEKEILREKDARNPKKDNKENPAYYPNFFNSIIKIMKEIYGEEEIKDKWEHLDLFFIRKTSQQNFKDLIKYKEKDDENVLIKSDFAKNQLKISLKYLQELEPKVIVVQNAMACRIILAKDLIDCNLNIKDKEHFNEKEGFHIIPINNRKVPILFSGMLSGQRALDRGSRKRLVWHIKRAIEWSNKNDQN